MAFSKPTKNAILRPTPEPRDKPAEPVSASPRQVVAWTAVLVTAYAVTAVPAWERTLIGPEIWALFYASKSLPEQMESVRYDLVHPPVTYLIERIWIQWVGLTDHSVKFLPFLLNMPTIVLFTKLAARVTPMWRMASFLFCGVFFHANSPPNQVRMYGLVLLGTVAAILIWSHWREQPRASTLAAWALAMTLLVWTHFFGALALAAFLLVGLIWGPDRKSFLLAACVPTLAGLAWLLYVLPTYLAYGLAANVVWVKHPLRELAELFVLFMGFLQVPSTTDLRRALIILAVLVHAALFALAWVKLRGWDYSLGLSRGVSRWFWPISALAVIPVALLFVASFLFQPAFHARLVIGALPAYWLLVVLLAGGGGRKGRWLLYGVFGPWVIVSSLFAMKSSTTPSLARQVTSVLAGEVEHGDLILCAGADVCDQIYWEWKYKLNRAPTVELLQLSSNSRLRPTPLGLIPRKDIQTIDLMNASRVWLFCPLAGEARPFTAKLAARGFDRSERFKLEDSRSPFLVLFVRNST